MYKKIAKTSLLLLPLLLVIGGTFAFVCKNNDKKIDQDKRLVAVIPSYNNAKWYKKNLDSILEQDATYRIIYINDASKDRTGERIENYLKERKCDYKVIEFNDEKSSDIETTTKQFSQEVNQNRVFFTLVNNVNRCGALQNLYRAIHSCDDEEIVVTIDGDDWLAHNKVFKNLKRIYSKKNIWLTHGSLKHYPDNVSSWCENVPKKLVKQNAFRTFKCPSHLRTFYAWLFKKVKLEDLLYHGEFFSMTWDMAMMYPMIEMAGNRHAFIKEAIYIYNIANEINDNKVNAELQRSLDTYVRTLPPYQKLEKDF